jgi:drug/metabolite transporter (DMT)-like permease
VTPIIRIAVPAIFTCLLWGSSFVFSKIGLTHTSPILLAGVRFLLAGLLLLPFCGDPRRWGPAVAAQWRLVALVCFFTTALHYALFYSGMALVRGAQGALIVGSAPLLTALLAHAFTPDDRLTLRKTASIGLGMVGMACVALASHPWQAAGLREIGGMALLVLCEGSFVFGTLLVRRITGPALPPVALNSAQMMAGGVLLLLVAPLLDRPLVFHAVPALWISLAALAAISAVGFTIWFSLLQRVKASALNLWMFLIPVFGATLSWCFLPGEHPDALSLAGMAIIVAAIILFYGQRTPAGDPASVSYKASEVSP